MKFATRCIGALAVWAAACTASAQVAEWTLLVYLNGKNNLEAAALTDFYEMAEVGSTSKLNVVVQLGRPQQHFTDADGAWSGVKRFRVGLGSKPRAGSELMDLGRQGLNTDMADPATLEEFIRWGHKAYPARRHMLVIWNHGQGWRFQLAGDRAVKAAGARANRSATDMQLLTGVPPTLAGAGGHRAVSSDDDTGGILYNRQIQEVLQKLARENLRFDVVGFDACLMAMVETAYALRNTAQYMVASEELEPNNGWNWRTLLQRVAARPDMPPADLSKAIVASYRDHYQNGDRTTLSAVQLSGMEPLARALSSLSELLLAELAAQRPRILAARAAVQSFADWYTPPMRTSIDLKLFLENLQKGNPDARVRAAVAQVIALHDAAVIGNYRAAPVADDNYGGNGLAIYFPRDRATFDADEWRDGYLAGNTRHPLEFVQSPETSGWPRLVRAVLDIP